MVRCAVGGSAEPMHFRCEACDYAYELDRQLRKPARLDRKVIDDVISLEDVMKNAPQTKGAACGSSANGTPCCASACTLGAAGRPPVQRACLA